MKRGLKTAWCWRSAYWRRRFPGWVGGVFYVLLPGLFLLPLEAVPLFQERGRGIVILSWLLSVALALGVGTGRGLREEDSVWLIQKGISPGEAALEDWILDMVFFALAVGWWASVGALALWGLGVPPVGSWVALFSFGLATCAITRTFAGLLSGWGTRRTSDLVVLGALLSLTAPVLLVKRSALVQRLADWAFPPFLEAATLLGAIRAGDLSSGAGALLHLLLFVGVCLAGGVGGISRWKPKG
ncbi:MAG: hypothetical protein MUO50_11250 [Longimicrobiales bacterium]|nr:hypothetical protein [Longimicrobiales bacterium]